MKSDSDRETTDQTEAAGHDVSTLVSQVNVGVVEISPGGVFLTVNDAFAVMTGHSTDRLEGASVSVVFPATDVANIVASLQLRDRSRRIPSVSTVVPLETADGDTIPCGLQLDLLGDPEDSSNLVGLVRKVTENRTLQRQQSESAWARSFLALAEAIPDGIIVLDTESEILYANPAVETILGHSPAEVVGGSKLNIIPPRLRNVHLAALNRYLETGERHINWSYVELPGQHAEGHEVPLGISLNDFTIDGVRFFVGLFRDITPRKRAEREAVVRVAQQEMIAALGQRALEAETIDAVLDDITDLLVEILDTTYSSVFELDSEADELRLRSVHGIPDASAGSVAVPTDSDHNQAGYALQTDEPVIITDHDRETRFDIPDGIRQRGVRSGISVTIGSTDESWGVLNVHDTAPREFTQRDIHAVKSVANILASAIDRHERTQKIETQRAQLSTVTQVYRVVRDIQRAIVRRSNREDVEQAVCDRLVELERYELACVGDIEGPAQALSPRTHAGDGANYLEESEVSLTQGVRGRQLGGEAIKTGETVIVSNVAEDERFVPWRDRALEYGFCSLAIVPITHKNRVFGVLVIYASEAGTFGPEVRDVFDTLGDVIGHALTAISQRQALHGDEQMEVELQLEGTANLFDERVDATRLEFEFDRVIPVGDERYLMFASTPMSADSLSTLESLEMVESVTTVSEIDGERRLEINLKEPPVNPIVVSFGGRIKRGAVDGDTTVMAMELPPGAEVNSLVEQIEKAHPEIDVTLRQRVTRASPDARRTREEILAPLTDRQLTALETAYFSGYFEWPRECSGEEVADTLAVSGATFSQHIRSAQRRLLGRLLEDTPPK